MIVRRQLKRNAIHAASLALGLLIGTQLSTQEHRAQDPSVDPILRACEGRYALTSGGSFDLKSEGGDLVLEPRNQEALTAIGFPGRNESPSREYIGLTELAVDKLIKNDLKAFRKEAGASRLVTWFVKKNWKGMVEGMGRPNTFEFIGTIPDGEEVASIVKLQLEVGPQFFWLNWKGRKLKSVGHGHRVPGVPWFNSGAASTFVPSITYPGTAQWKRLTFDVDSNGNITGLRLYSTDALNELAAQKIQP